jgi:hypothetical protein
MMDDGRGGTLRAFPDGKVSLTETLALTLNPSPPGEGVSQAGRSVRFGLSECELAGKNFRVFPAISAYFHVFPDNEEKKSFKPGLPAPLRRQHP